MTSAAGGVVGWLPFYSRFRAPILAGVKTMTTRTRRFGRVGDVLATPFGPVRLVAVEQVALGIVEAYWREEGCASPEGFREVWRTIHPVRGYRPDDQVWLHTFEVVA